MKRRSSYRDLISLAICISVVLVACGAWLIPSTVHAQTWPTSWIQIDTDPDEAGPANNYRDVSDAYFNFDSTYLYLRLENYAAPQFPAVGSRFKWLIDVGVLSTLYWSGQNILGADFLLFVEDSDNDGGRDVYLLDAQGDDRFGQYEPNVYKSSPGPITDTTVAGYRVVGNSVDLYVRISALGLSSPTGIALAWATDQENPNLEQAPTLDSTDLRDTPILLDADLAVRKTVSNPNPVPGSQITYGIRVTNSGPASATNIEITDLLPTGVTYQSYSASQGSYTSGTGVWLVGDLDNAEFATLSITATVDLGGGGTTVTNWANVTDVDQPDPDSGDNSDFAVIFPTQTEADLAVCKTVDDHTPDIGQTIVYTLRVCNSGPSSANNIEVTDLLPAGVTYQSHSASQGTYTSSTGIWSIGSLANAASVTLTIAATVDLCHCGSTITNTATITQVTENDPQPEDNSDWVAIFPFRVYTPPTVAPPFPSVYWGIAAAFAAATLACLWRLKLGRQA